MCVCMCACVCWDSNFYWDFPTVDKTFFHSSLSRAKCTHTHTYTQSMCHYIRNGWVFMVFFWNFVLWMRKWTEINLSAVSFKTRCGSLCCLCLDFGSWTVTYRIDICIAQNVNNEHTIFMQCIYRVRDIVWERWKKAGEKREERKWSKLVLTISTRYIII